MSGRTWARCPVTGLPVAQAERLGDEFRDAAGDLRPEVGSLLWVRERLVAAMGFRNPSRAFRDALAHPEVAWTAATEDAEGLGAPDRVVARGMYPSSAQAAGALVRAANHERQVAGLRRGSTVTDPTSGSASDLRRTLNTAIPSKAGPLSR